MRDGNRTHGKIHWAVVFTQLQDWRLWLNIAIYVSPLVFLVLSYQASLLFVALSVHPDSIPSWSIALLEAIPSDELSCHEWLADLSFGGASPLTSEDSVTDPSTSLDVPSNLNLHNRNLHPYNRQDNGLHQRQSPIDDRSTLRRRFRHGLCGRIPVRPFPLLFRHHGHQLRRCGDRQSHARPRPRASQQRTLWRNVPDHLRHSVRCDFVRGQYYGQLLR